MPESLQLLFSIKATHSYFDDQSCRVLDFQPDERTQALFKNLQCQFRSKEGEVQVYGPADKTKSELLSMLNSKLESDAEIRQNYFKFNLISSDQTFFMFTELPIDSHGRILYESSSDSLELKETLAEERNAMSVGSVHIGWDDCLGNDDVSPQFELACKARSVELRYHIIPQDTNTDTLAIKSETNIQFDGPNSEKLPNGADGHLFTSGETLLPFSQRAKNNFKLIIDSGAGNRHEIRLPDPSPQQAVLTETDGKKVAVANVYVYI